MKHSKKILALVLSMAVVASLAAAGTLAWLSDSQEMSNSFTVDTNSSAVKITLTEAPVNSDTGKEVPGDRVSDGQVYNKLMPNKVLDKDPRVDIAADSADCYVFMGVKNGMAGSVTLEYGEAQILGTTTNTVYGEWKFVQTKGDYDVYQYSNADGSLKAAAAGAQLSPLFENVRVNSDLEADGLQELDGKTIEVKAYAVQADEITAEAVQDDVFGGTGPFVPAT